MKSNIDVTITLCRKAFRLIEVIHTVHFILDVLDFLIRWLYAL